jgi:aspartokinase/homoserine dehydrogenase 1
MQVLKFGGTSVGSIESMVEVMQIILNSTNKKKTIVVVSAFATITNKLLSVIQEAKNGNERYQITLDDIKYLHFDRVESLQLKNIDEAKTYIETEISIISDLCKGIYLTKSISKKTEAIILSVGEKLSSYILANSLGVAHVDSQRLIKTQSNYNNATVDFKQTNTNIQVYFAAHSEPITILSGFIASNQNNETTTLGRGGSDYTASIIAAALNAEKLEIWTDVSGMYTANPSIVKSAFPIEKISYQEAMELSHFGAKVIYPPTIIPVLDKHIPICIKNTFKKEEKGTLISNETVNHKTAITGISHIENIALITLEGNGMIGIPGFSKRLFEALYYEKINVKLITQASSEHSICIAIDIADVDRVAQVVNQQFEYEILTRKVLPLQIETDLSIIALVGDQMKSHQGISGKLFSTLGYNNVNVRAIAQGASEKNISVVIATKNVSKAINSLHAKFFENQIKQINLFITGVGNVGSKLIAQIKQQQDFLLNKLHLDLRVIALANSKKMIFNNQGINLATWQTEFDTGEETSFQLFFDKVKEQNLRNSIFVDNTANKDITNFYQAYLKESIAVVTCNKIACSSEYENYENLQYLAKKYQVPFLYETNVGAGLPIIDTVKNLIASGDEITEIQAVLSGSLNYIFNNFDLDETHSFYNVVKQAGVEGFTEPDPRIDLSGVDVMRKILILVRESGLKMELNDIENISFLPKSANEANSVANFMETLKEEKEHFENILKKANMNNCQLKYVASFKNGKAKVSLQEIESTHPFYNLNGSDNIVMLYTNRYVNQPLIIKGAGAGADVTASGIFADIIRS